MELFHDDSSFWPIVPPLAIVVYIICVAGAGALANCTVLAALLKKPRSGLFTIFIQLAMTDLFLLGGTAAPELWVQNAQIWPFGLPGCKVYRGLNVLTSTACLYLIVTITLHTLATVNLGEKIADRRRAKRNCEEDEIQSSRHSLVANSDSSTPPRTMNIDYRMVNTRVPVVPPSVFVWVLSASLSVPEFVLATTVRLNNSTESCTFVEPAHQISMHSMLTIFNLFLPLIIFCSLGALVVSKLNSKSILPELDKIELNSALKLSLCLMSTYVLLCLPRTILVSFIVYSTSITESETVQLNQDLYSREVLAKLGLATTGAYLLASLIRPLLCILLLPRLRRIFVFRAHTDETNDV